MEAAPRDPAKLRKTALVLISVAVVGSLLVVADYLRDLKRQEAIGRPPFVGRLESNFGAVRHDKKGVGLAELEGKVWLVTSLCLSQLEQSSESLRMMQFVADRYAQRDDLQFVCFTVDPERDEPERMAAFAVELGVADDARWWFLAAGVEQTRGYLKTKLKLGAVSEVTENGTTTIRFDSILGIVDQDRNIRGRYDFLEAQTVQEKTRQMLAEHSDGLDELSEQQRATLMQNQEAEQVLEDHLLHALDFIFDEKDRKAEERS